MHGGKQTSRVNRGECVGVEGIRIHHGESVEPLRQRTHGCGDRRFVAGHAGDERRSLNALPIELGGPDFGELFRIFRRQAPAELLARGFDGQAGLLRSQRREKVVREKMNVRIGDRQRTPRRFPFEHGRGHGRAPGTWVRPVDSASCVSPATLFTPSFRIMVLR